jgi:predicted secreted protein
VETLELRVQQSHALTLNSLGSAGYRWSVAVDDPRIVLVERVRTVRGREEFALTGLTSGETVVHFVQARSFEPDKPPLSTYDIRVRVGN